MSVQSYCCCLRATEKTDSKPTNVTLGAGVNNKSFEAWEPFTQQNTSTIALEDEPKLSKSSHNSFESIQLSKMDLNLNIFENNRFCDVSEAIHKSNAQKDEEHIQS